MQPFYVHFLLISLPAYGPCVKEPSVLILIRDASRKSAPSPPGCTTPDYNNNMAHSALFAIISRPGPESGTPSSAHTGGEGHPQPEPFVCRPEPGLRPTYSIGVNG